MLDINDTKMKYEDNPENKNHATCTCEPLDRGYGTTIGSSLKRILLSSIQGAAVVAVRFNGADSMEDQLEGVKDSIQDIVLRLRELSIKPVEAPIKAVVNVEAGAEDTQVTVADITCEDQEQELEILEPETCLATVKAGGKLVLQMRKLKVRALYNVIPERLTINVAHLGLGKTVKVGELQYEGLELLNAKEAVVCAVKLTRAARGAAAAAGN